jgi:hypothetical protein
VGSSPKKGKGREGASPLATLLRTRDIKITVPIRTGLESKTFACKKDGRTAQVGREEGGFSSILKHECGEAVHRLSGIDPESWQTQPSMQTPNRGSRQRVRGRGAMSLRAYKSEKWHSHGNSHRQSMGRNISLGVVKDDD